MGDIGVRLAIAVVLMLAVASLLAAPRSTLSVVVLGSLVVAVGSLTARTGEAMTTNPIVPSLRAHRARPPAGLPLGRSREWRYPR